MRRWWLLSFSLGLAGWLAVSAYRSDAKAGTALVPAGCESQTVSVRGTNGRTVDELILVMCPPDVKATPAAPPGYRYVPLSTPTVELQ